MPNYARSSNLKWEWESGTAVVQTPDRSANRSKLMRVRSAPPPDQKTEQITRFTPKATELLRIVAGPVRKVVGIRLAPFSG